MLQQDEMVVVMMMVLVVEMMMMMIPMKTSSMAVTMAMVSPSGREFPRQICSMQESFSLFVVSAPQRRRNNSLDNPPELGFPWRRYTRKRSVRGGPGPPDPTQARPGWARAGVASGALVAPLDSPFCLPSSSGKIGTLGIFLKFIDLPKYGVLMVTFPAEFQLWQQIILESSNMQK